MDGEVTKGGKGVVSGHGVAIEGREILEEWVKRVEKKVPAKSNGKARYCPLRASVVTRSNESSVLKDTPRTIEPRSR